MAKALFNIDGEILGNVLSKILQTGSATFQTEKKHKFAERYQVRGGVDGAPFTYTGASPLFIRVEKDFVEFKTLGENLNVTAKITAGDGVNINTSTELIIPPKNAKIISRIVKSECLYTFYNVTAKEFTVSDGIAELTLSKIEDALLSKNFKQKEQNAADFVAIQGGDFQRLVKQVAYVPVKAQYSRLFKLADTSINFNRRSDSLTLTALSATRLAVTSQRLDTAKECFSFNAPAEAVRFTAKLATKNAAICIGYCSESGEVQFQTDCWVIQAQCVDCELPDYAPLLNPDAPVVAEVNCAELVASLTLCKFASGETNEVKLVFGRGGDMEICAESCDCKARKYLRAESISGVQFGDAELKLNITSLLETLKTFCKGSIKIAISKKGALISHEDTLAFIAPFIDSVKLPVPPKALPEKTFETITLKAEEFAVVA